MRRVSRKQLEENILGLFIEVNLRGAGGEEKGQEEGG